MIGLSIAWQAAVAGLAVTVVDPAPGRGASWAAAGMLGPVGEAQFGEERLTALNLEAARAWPSFARSLEEASGLDVHLVSAGTLLVAVDSSDRVALDDLLDYRRSQGLSVERLSGSQCRRAEPLLSPVIRGGAELAGDHQVDNRRVVEALIAACRSRGVVMVADEVAEVLTESTAGAVRATGARLRAGGTVAAGTVVLAAGCRSALLGGLPPSALPAVRPVKGLTLRLRAGSGVEVLQRTLRGLVRGRACYLVPRPDRSVVVGASVEEKGFDSTVQAGPVGDLLDDARALVPTLEEYELEDITTGLRPGSPDNGPMVGPTAVTGLVVATGHYRNGILLAPLTATTVVSVLDGAAGWGDGPFARFGPDRFTGGRATSPDAGGLAPVGR